MNVLYVKGFGLIITVDLHVCETNLVSQCSNPKPCVWAWAHGILHYRGYEHTQESHIWTTSTVYIHVHRYTHGSILNIPTGIMRALNGPIAFLSFPCTKSTLQQRHMPNIHIQLTYSWEVSSTEGISEVVSVCEKDISEYPCRWSVSFFLFLYIGEVSGATVPFSKWPLLMTSLWWPLKMILPSGRVSDLPWLVASLVLTVPCSPLLVS